MGLMWCLMAARKNRGTKDRPMQDGWRKKIKAGVIMDRLMKCVDGTIELSAQQIKAADIILKKIEPDLARTELTGKDGGDIKVSWPLPQTKLDE